MTEEDKDLLDLVKEKCDETNKDFDQYTMDTLMGTTIDTDKVLNSTLPNRGTYSARQSTIRAEHMVNRLRHESSARMTDHLIGSMRVPDSVAESRSVGTGFIKNFNLDDLADNGVLDPKELEHPPIRDYEYYYNILVLGLTNKVLGRSKEEMLNILDYPNTSQPNKDRIVKAVVFSMLYRGEYVNLAFDTFIDNTTYIQLRKFLDVAVISYSYLFSKHINVKVHIDTSHDIPF